MHVCAVRCCAHAPSPRAYPQQPFLLASSPERLVIRSVVRSSPTVGCTPIVASRSPLVMPSCMASA